MRKRQLIGLLSMVILFSLSSCKKNSFAATDTLYVPTTTDVTATATLADLQSGYTLYKNRCGACHSLYSPDSYSSTNWKSILSGMATRAGLTSSESSLVLKYVTKGK